MTTLTLGSNRGSTSVAATFDDRSSDFNRRLRLAVQVCQAVAEYVGSCGHGSGDDLDSADWLVEGGVESIFPDNDTVVETWLRHGQTVPSSSTATSQGRRW